MKAEYLQEMLQYKKMLKIPGKGILMIDEAPKIMLTIFKHSRISNTEQTRQEYREMLISHPMLSHYITGIVLDEETIGQNIGGKTFPEFIQEKNLLLGVNAIKMVCQCHMPHYVSTRMKIKLPTNYFTEGLDDLYEKLARCYSKGCRLAKWSAFYTISNNVRAMEIAMRNNCWTTARFAMICQENRMLPLIDIQILNNGDHPIERCYSIFERILAETVSALKFYRVDLQALILSITMVSAGVENELFNYNDNRRAYLTYLLLLRTLPPALDFILLRINKRDTEQCFMNNLNQMKQLRNSSTTWFMTFQFSDKLLRSSRLEWAGIRENNLKAQEKLMECLELISHNCWYTEDGNVQPHFEDENDEQTDQLSKPV